jgi:hypothetical protein
MSEFPKRNSKIRRAFFQKNPRATTRHAGSGVPGGGCAGVICALSLLFCASRPEVGVLPRR